MGMRLNTGASWGTDSSNTEFRTTSDKVPNIEIDIMATKRIFACFLWLLSETLRQCNKRPIPTKI